MIRGTTRVIAILGDPVEHSRSPAMHNAAFAALGLDYAYVALRVRPADLRRAMLGVRALGLAGLNVTVPHKQAILPLLDRISTEALAIGAVNTVVRRGDQLEGHNTDAQGFLRAVARMGFRPKARSVVLLGAGGSARAAAWALAKGGVRSLTILNRDAERAAGVARMIRRRYDVATGAARLRGDTAKDALRRADLVVNCTSLGLDGRSAPPIEITATPAHCVVYDLVYARGSTPFVRAARRAGRRAEDGLGMLLEQAGLAFRAWTGRQAPLDVMAEALRDWDARPGRRPTRGLTPSRPLR